jgi:DNA repair exonuclease SbcCD nuclease subunit
VIVFSDLHLDSDSAEVCLGQILPGICEAAINSDRHVVFLGDWWHLRYRVDVRLQVAVLDELRRWAEKKVVARLLVGNHDQVDVAGRNALEVFSDLPNVWVYLNPVLDYDFVWLPYRRDTSAYDPAIPYTAGRTIFLHQSVVGAWDNNHHQTKDGFSYNQLEGARVFAGHFHKRQFVELGDTPVWFVGSPRQVTAAESAQDKGFCVLDGASVDFVNTNWGSRYHRFELAENEVLDLSGVKDGDDVRVVVAQETDVEKVGRQLDGLNVRHTVTPQVKSAGARHALDPESDLRAYAQAWICERDRDESRLMPVFDSIAGVEKCIS